MMYNRYGDIKIFNVKCEICDINFNVKEREKKFPEKEKYFCSRSCANTRKHTTETKKKISDTLKIVTDKSPEISKICDFCKCEYFVEYKRRKQKFCSRSCSTKH